jgi:alcohol dehydrogenase class IV
MPNDINIRQRLLKASNLAGLAFSNTKTAAAHSISYPLTFSFDVPHGIACSLPILPLLDINRDHIVENINLLLDTLGIDFKELKDQIANIPQDVIDFKLSDWGITSDDFDEIVERSFTNSRISNNIIDLSKNDVYNLLHEIL